MKWNYTFSKKGTLILPLFALFCVWGIFWYLVWPGILTRDAYHYLADYFLAKNVGEWPVPESKLYTVLFLGPYHIFNSLVPYFCLQVSVAMFALWRGIDLLPRNRAGFFVVCAVVVFLASSINTFLLFATERDGIYSWLVFLYLVNCLRIFSLGVDVSKSIRSIEFCIFIFCATALAFMRASGIFYFIASIFVTFLFGLSKAEIKRASFCYLISIFLLMVVPSFILRAPVVSKNIEGAGTLNPFVRNFLFLNRDIELLGGALESDYLESMRDKVPAEFRNNPNSEKIDQFRFGVDARASFEFMREFLFLALRNPVLFLEHRFRIFKLALENEILDRYRPELDPAHPRSAEFQRVEKIVDPRDTLELYEDGNIPQYFWNKLAGTFVPTLILFLALLIPCLISREGLLTWTPVVLNFLVVFFLQPLPKSRYLYSFYLISPLQLLFIYNFYLSKGPYLERFLSFCNFIVERIRIFPERMSMLPSPRLKLVVLRIRKLIHSGMVSRIGLVILILIFIGKKMPLLSHPAFWDEVNSYFGGALWLVDNGLQLAVTGLHPSGVFYGHTPGYPFVIGLLYQLTGSIAVLRLTSVLLSAWQVVLVFQVSEFLKRGAGIWSAFFLVLIATFYSHATLLVADLAVATFGLAALNRAIRKDFVGFGIWGSLAILSKETALASVAPVALYLIWKNGGIGWRKKLAILSPLILLLFHFFLGYLFQENPLLFPRMETVDFSFVGVLSRSLDYGYHQFFHFQGHVLWFLSALAGAIVFLLFGEKDKKVWVYLIICSFFCYLTGVASLTEYNFRYFLPNLSYLALLGGVLFGFRRKMMFLAGVVLTFQMGQESFSYNNGSDRHPGNGFEESMQYVDVVKVHKEAIGWLESVRRDGEEVYAVWPIYEYLREPRFGYVNQQVPVMAELKETSVWAILAENSHSGYSQRQAREIKEPGWSIAKEVNLSEKKVAIWKRAPAKRKVKTRGMNP